MTLKKPLPLRSPKYAVRLRKACDEHSHCPALHEGRLTWLQRRLAEKQTQVSIESIRKWLSGEGRPKEERSDALAAVLGVDQTWLYVGKMAAADTQAETSMAPQNSEGDNWLPISIRPNWTVRIFGLPHDLSRAEAQKVANIILAHTTVE